VVVDGGLTRCAGQVLAILEGDVLLALGVEVALGESEVDQLNRVAVVSVAHEEVVGFGVAVDEVVVVDTLHAGQHLVCQHEHRLERELLPTFHAQVVKRGPECLHHELVVVSFGPLLLDLGDAQLFLEMPLDLVLLHQLLVFHSFLFEFHCH